EFFRFDESTVARSVLWQAEAVCGKAGSFEINRVERISGGLKVLMYTDKNPQNRGELWLTFRYNDDKLAKGFVQASQIDHPFDLRTAARLHAHQFDLRM